MQKLHERYKDTGFTVLTVTDDNPKRARHYLRKKGFTFAAAWDRGGRLGKKFKVNAIPFTAFVDGTGKVVADLTGGFSEREAAELIDKILQ